MRQLSRREFVGGAVGASAALLLDLGAFAADVKFKVGVISDEISQDFDHACHVISKDFGLHWVELREIWGKNLQVISDAQIAEAQKILAKYGLQVTDIASPLFKVNWPGAPVSQYGTKEDTCNGADEVSFKHQDEVLDLRYIPRETIQNEQGPLFRLLAHRRDQALPRRYQRQAAAGRRIRRRAEHHARARK